MSTDLSRPLVPLMGAYDALDGFVTFRQAQYTTERLGDAGATALSGAIESLAALCRHRGWKTDDWLGIGGLLFDACRQCRLPDHEVSTDLLEGLGRLSWRLDGPSRRPTAEPAGLAALGIPRACIGLRGLPIMVDAIGKQVGRFGRAPT